MQALEKLSLQFKSLQNTFKKFIVSKTKPINQPMRLKSSSFIQANCESKNNVSVSQN